MVVAKSLTEYRKIQEQRIQKLKRVRNNTPIKGAKYMAAVMRKTAPRQSGRLLSSIRRRGKVVRVGGTDPRTGFPYIHWVNQTKGFRTLTYKRPNKRLGLKPGMSITYGSTPSHWNWTGTPGFVTLARLKSRAYFRKVILRETRRAITLKI